MAGPEQYKKIEAEFEAIKKDFGLIKLEIEEEQRILPLLKKLRLILSKIARAVGPNVGRSDTTFSLRSHIISIIKNLADIIKLLEKDKKIDIIILKENRREAKKAYEWRVENKKMFAEMAENFKILKYEEGKKEHFEKEHLEFLGDICGAFYNINRNIVFEKSTDVYPLLVELKHYFGQLYELMVKEMVVLREEASAK